MRIPGSSTDRSIMLLLLLRFCSAVGRGSKQASLPRSSHAFQPFPANNGPAQECGHGRRAAAGARNADTHLPRKHKAPVGRKIPANSFLPIPSFPPSPVAVAFFFFVAFFSHRT
ncbi:hypothetical protein QBC39DRAFT_364723 [Podospora conica]|nr:hypothetical protein QBC39DRAFT_364723 [Schizothecium conicum]